jgi:alcohol dehydrogenase class IV
MDAVESGRFEYANPGRISFGTGALGRLGEELARVQAQRVFVLTTRSVERNEVLFGELRAALGAPLAGHFAGIGQHAPAASVMEAVAAARSARADALVSFGGGSPIDAAKAVAFSLATGLDLTAADAVARAQRMTPVGLLPHIAVPTTLSAAELSGLAGFTSEDEHEKVGLRGEALIPTAVILDAKLSLHTPLDLWLSTGIRAVDHAVESVLAEGSHPFSDVLALDALRRLQWSLLATRKDPENLAARTESQLGAWFSFTLPGPAAGGLSHTLSKRIGARHGIPHGVSSCLLLPHVMRYLAPRHASRLARIAAALGVDTREMPDSVATERAANRVAELIERLELPHHLAAYGLSEADLEAAARPVASDEYALEDLVAIYRAAM